MIISGEIVAVPQEVIRMPEVPSPVIPANENGMRDVVLPVVGSFLLWTGRELIPRLVDVALGRLDQRIQSSTATASQRRRSMLRGARSTKPTHRKESGRGRQRRLRNRRSG